jgi:hypothetical protein
MISCIETAMDLSDYLSFLLSSVVPVTDKEENNSKQGSKKRREDETTFHLVCAGTVLASPLLPAICRCLTSLDSEYLSTALASKSTFEEVNPSYPFYIADGNAEICYCGVSVLTLLGPSLAKHMQNAIHVTLFLPFFYLLADDL